MSNQEANDQKMSDFRAQLAREAEEHHAALLNTPAAVRQLMKTERGGRALLAFTRLCEVEGLNLPPADWRALSTLCLASGFPAAGR